VYDLDESTPDKFLSSNINQSNNSSQIHDLPALRRRTESKNYQETLGDQLNIQMQSS
jgi:hypothetical protein